MPERIPDPNKAFLRERDGRIEAYAKDKALNAATAEFLYEIVKNNYAFNFSWLGRPVIQIPQDLMALQEIIWETKPDYIIETGIAHGGSIIFYASMLQLMGKGQVIGIDIDIREHNRIAIETHPVAHRINMIEGSSIDEKTIEKVKSIVKNAGSILVVLDSNHTHEHVLRELELYTPFVSLHNYCVVFDTGIEDLPEGMITDRPWGRGNNPKTAVWEFLKSNDQFVIDKNMEAKLLITAAPDGFLKRVR